MREPGVAGDDSAADGRNGGDASLAQRAVARDPQAWTELFDRHWHSVFGFVRYRLGGANDAEDLASQVFEIAYSRAGSFDFRGVPIEAWLIGIARNLCRDHIKKLARRGPTEDLDDNTGPIEDDPAATADLRHDLSVAMRALTEDQQEVLVLRFLLDRSVEDTARIMNRSDDAVKNLQRRALAAMHHALAEANYPGMVKS